MAVLQCTLVSAPAWGMGSAIARRPITTSTTLQCVAAPQECELIYSRKTRTSAKAAAARPRRGKGPLSQAPAQPFWSHRWARGAQRYLDFVTIRQTGMHCLDTQRWLGAVAPHHVAMVITSSRGAGAKAFPLTIPAPRNCTASTRLGVQCYDRDLYSGVTVAQAWKVPGEHTCHAPGARVMSLPANASDSRFKMTWRKLQTYKTLVQICERQVRRMGFSWRDSQKPLFDPWVRPSGGGPAINLRALVTQTHFAHESLACMYLLYQAA